MAGREHSSSFAPHRSCACRMDGSLERLLEGGSVGKLPVIRQRLSLGWEPEEAGLSLGRRSGPDQGAAGPQLTCLGYVRRCRLPSWCAQAASRGSLLCMRRRKSVSCAPWQGARTCPMAASGDLAVGRGAGLAPLQGEKQWAETGRAVCGAP